MERVMGWGDARVAIPLHCKAKFGESTDPPPNCNYEGNIRPGAQFHCKISVGMKEIINVFHPKQKSPRS